MKDREFSEINVIPLVDIMLVLLTIVLTTTTFIITGHISVNLPGAKNRDIRAENPIYITLTKDNRLFIDKMEVADMEVINHLKRFSKEKPVVIRADEEVPLKRFAFVVDKLKGEGFAKVSMEVKER